MAAQQVSNASLYVGDLAPDVTDQDLQSIFSQHGTVKMVKLNLDIVTRRSRGYAYVNFDRREEAEAAMNALNYTELKGKEIRIMWSQRDPALRKSGIGNVFIKNLHPSITSRQLYDTFSQVGNILSCKVALDSKGQSRGYGFVHFETQEAANQAISKINGMQLMDKDVFVGPFIPRRQRQQDSDSHFTNVYVKNFDDSVTDEILKEEFSKFGVVKSVKVMIDADGKSRRFGFVDFENSDAAAKAVTEVNDHTWRGAKVYCGRAQRKTERMAELARRTEQIRNERRIQTQGLNMFVKNLDETVDDAKLLEFFKDCGPITSAKVMRDDNKMSKGFGFVCFTNADDARRAMIKDNHMLLTKPIRVRYALPKEARKAQLESFFNQLARPPMGFMGVPAPAGPGMGAVVPTMAPGGAGAFVPSMRYPGGPGMPPGGPMQPVGAFYPSMMPPQRVWTAPPQQPGYPIQWGGSAAGRRMGGNQRRGGGQPYSGPAKRTYRGGPGPAGGVGMVRRDPAAPGSPSDIGVAGAAGPMYVAPAASEADASGKPDEERKKVLGETLYPRVCAVNTGKIDRNPKITGMLLALGDAEMDRVLREPEYLKSRVMEANNELDRVELAALPAPAPVPVAAEAEPRAPQ